MRATTREKRSDDGPEAHETATRSVTHPKDGASAAAKERGSSLNTPQVQDSPTQRPHQSWSLVFLAQHRRKKGNASLILRISHPTTFPAHMLRLSSDTHAPYSSALGCLTLALLSGFLLCILVVSFLLRHHLPAPRTGGGSNQRSVSVSVCL
jgi:hypothetical protein